MYISIALRKIILGKRFKVAIYQLKFILFELVILFLIYRDKSRNSARITCRVCLEDYQTSINFLSEPIDVYNDWVDACENAN